MTHTRQYAEHEGTLSPIVVVVDGRKCPKCSAAVQYQAWHSSDGAYEDFKYTCTDPFCDWVQWVDGIDS